MREIQLTRGQVALVDDADYEWLNQWSWYASLGHGNWYAMRKPMRGVIQMHRLIMGCTKGDGLYVDHINNNTLDNRRENLRFCTNSQNMMNRKRTPTGVHFYKRHQKWTAHININYEKIHLGYFSTREEAIAARLAAERIHFKEFAPAR